MEIGTWKGASLEVSKCASIAIDPHFELDTNVVGSTPFCGLYQMTSDDFFALHNPAQILGGEIDLAFLDGLHLFEALLRDFINTEKSSKRNSVLALHDCLPPDAAWTKRESPGDGGAWTGDVWKVPLILRKYRPDLKIYLFNSPPTGMVLVTNLDPHSDVLSKDYYEIIQEFRDLDLLSLVANEMAPSFEMIDTGEIASYHEISRYFWL
jgi:hypothetical protein